MVPKRSCCIRFCRYCLSSSSSDENRQDNTSAIGTPSVAPNNSEPQGTPSVAPSVAPNNSEANLCNVSGPAHQSNKDQDENVNVNKNVSADPAYNETPPTASIEASKCDMHAKASTSVPSTGSTPSSSSPSQPTKSGLLKAMVHQVEGKGVDVNLNDLILDHISKFLELREQEMLRNEKSLKHSNFPWPEGFKKLKGILSFATDLKKFTESLQRGLEFASKLEKIISGPVKTLLKDIGQASIVTAGLLVVAYALEKFDEFSTNKDKCWFLIKEMRGLATVVKMWNESSRGRVDVIEDATAFVVEGAIMCCTKISGSAWNRFLLSSDHKDDLSEITQKLQCMYMKIIADIVISNSNDIKNLPNSTLKSKKNPPVSRRFPENAVGIHKPIKDVLGLLDCESEQKAVTVVLLGLEGMGKTTLADAVVSQEAVGGYAYSHVRLFKDRDSIPDILSLQEKILNDLMDGQGKAVPNIRKYEDGQTHLQCVLTEVDAFIYIDNVLQGEALKNLLPSDMSKAKKVRLLVTARDKHVKFACPRPCTEPKEYMEYMMNGIQDEGALKILKNEIKEGISQDQFDEIIHTCGGNPCKLTLIATFIGRSENKEEAYSELMRQKDKWTIEGLTKMLYHRPPEDAVPGRDNNIREC